MALFKLQNESTFNGPHQGQPIHDFGAEAKDAKAAMIMVHGRGASAESILTLAEEFENVEGFLFCAPQAKGFTWYPYSFLMPKENNQPGLDSALTLLSDIVAQLESEGFKKRNIFILGFSQGACLASEFVAINAAEYGGLFVLSGGLIGDSIQSQNFSGDMSNTPVFLGCSDVDPHIPKERVDETEMVFNQLGAKVTKRIYPNMGHLINEDEIEHINAILKSRI